MYNTLAFVCLYLIYSAPPTTTHLYQSTDMHICRRYDFLYFFLQCSDTVGWVTGKACKNWVLVCWWLRFDWSFACLIDPVVTTTSIILSSNKIPNGNILVLANPGPRGKWPLKRREGTIFCIVDATQKHQTICHWRQS